MQVMGRRSFLVRTSALGASALLGTRGAFRTLGGNDHPGASTGAAQWSQAVSPQLADLNTLLIPHVSVSYDLNVQTQLVDTGALGAQSMLSGVVKAAQLASQPIPTLLGQGAHFKLIAATVSGGNIRFLVSTSIQTPQEMEGRKIGLPIGTIVQFAFSLYCRKQGIDETAVTVVNLQPAEMVAALVQGSIDGYLWGQPTLNDGIVALGASKVHLLEPAVTDYWPANDYLMIGRPSASESERQVVEDYLSSLIAANQFIKEHFTEAASIVGKILDLDTNTVIRLVRQSRYDYKCDIDQGAVSELSEVTAWLTQQNLVPLGIDPNSTWDASYLQAVSPTSIHVNV